MCCIADFRVQAMSYFWFHAIVVQAMSSHRVVCVYNNRIKNWKWTQTAIRVNKTEFDVGQMDWKYRLWLKWTRISTISQGFVAQWWNGCLVCRRSWVRVPPKPVLFFRKTSFSFETFALIFKQNCITIKWISSSKNQKTLFQLVKHVH